MGAPGILAFAHKNGHLSRYQSPEDNRRQRITRGGRGGETMETEGQTTDDPSGANRDLGAGQGRQGGAKGHRTRQKKKSRGAGCRDEWHRIVDDMCGQSPGGQRTTTGYDVGIRCYK